MARYIRIAARRRAGPEAHELVRRLTRRVLAPFAGLLYSFGRKLPYELLSKRIRVTIFLSGLPMLNVMGMLSVMVN